MALEPGSGAFADSPGSSGRDSPIPRQWRNQLGGEELPAKDKAYRRYASGVEKALLLFETVLEEWADYISFLNRLLKALQARPHSVAAIPHKATVSKRLSQCLNPSLPSGVHQKALEVYSHVFSTIGKDGLSRDLPLYLPGLAPTLTFASLSARSPFLDLLETYFLQIDPRSLRPAMKSIILALLPGLEDETSEDFDRTLSLMASFKEALRPPESKVLTKHHSSGDDFFWQCFFLASITSHSRRAGALAYLVRHLPVLGRAPTAAAADGSPLQTDDDDNTEIAAMVTSPEPGLLVRCFASGLADEQLLIQRGFLDLLVSHLPLNSSVLQSRVKPADLELLLRVATAVVTRRDMSLNRRLWAWLLGPEPASLDGDPTGDLSTAPPEHPQVLLSSRTTYFEEFGLQPLTRALLDMIRDPVHRSSAERTRPYRICLSLMDRWEIGGLVAPEVFLPVIESVRQYKKHASERADFSEVLRSASVFFDGIESGLIYSELVSLLAQAVGPGTLPMAERLDKVSLVSFIVANFNVREEEMVTMHAPLTCLAALSMLEDTKGRKTKGAMTEAPPLKLIEHVLGIVASLVELVPERAFPNPTNEASPSKATSLPNAEILKRIKTFYVRDQGSPDGLPFSAIEMGELLLQKAVRYMCEDADTLKSSDDLGVRVRILITALLKTPTSYSFGISDLLSHIKRKLAQQPSLPFSYFSTMMQLATQLYTTERIGYAQLSDLVVPLVRHAWSYLAASDPKYHVETVRSLWQLQTVLTPASRDVEAALSEILVDCQSSNQPVACSAEASRTFAVLWSHTLQDSASDRRGSRSQSQESRSPPRLAGMDHYQVMLTQPLFLTLDALVDERTQLSMIVKSWLNSMVGIDRLLLLFVAKMSELPFLETVSTCAAGQRVDAESVMFGEADDLDLCLYYFRTLQYVLRCTGEVSLAVVSSKYLHFGGGQIHLRAGSEEGEMTLQEYFVRVCMRCITSEVDASCGLELVEGFSQMQRYSLMLLHQFLASKHVAPLAGLHVDYILIDRLLEAIENPDPHVQVLLLDTISDTLKLQDMASEERPTSRSSEMVHLGADRPRANRASISLSDSRPMGTSMPPQLLKCLQAGFSSASSRAVLASWVPFLADCLQFYSHSIFQILIPLVETLCGQIGRTLSSLQGIYQAEGHGGSDENVPESALIYLLNGLEQVLALSHDQLIAEETRAQIIKGPEQPQSLFGSMVSGVFQSEGPQSRSATANGRLTVHLAFQDAVRICFKIWSWGQGEEAKMQDPISVASFTYTSLRMRNRARRLLEHLFAAETLECLETVIDIWTLTDSAVERSVVFSFLSALDACRPRHSIPALFNSIYSRTNPGALDPLRKSTMTISLQDTDLVLFLVEYARSLDDDAMDEIWQDCMTFLRDLLGNPFPHRQALPSLLRFAGILGEKVDNTNFGEQRRMRRELGDLFLRLLAALFTTRPITFPDSSHPNSTTEKSGKEGSGRRGTATNGPEGAVAVLASVLPSLPQILLENDRVLSAAATISTNVMGPTLRSKSFPDTVSRSTMTLLHELSQLQNTQKTWKKDVGDAFNDSRFFGMKLDLVKDGWLPLLKQWILTDKDKMPEIVGRISAPTTAGIVFGVGATSARLETDRKTQLNLRRIATLILASADDAFVGSLGTIFDKLVELLAATATSSPSSVTRADVFMVVRALVLKTSPEHVALLWPVVNAEMHAAISSAVAPDHSPASEVYGNTAVFQACKLLDLLICVAPDDFQLHEWLFVTDTIDAIYAPPTYQPVALVDELSEELGSSAAAPSLQADAATHFAVAGALRRPLLGAGGLCDDDDDDDDDDDVGLQRRDEFAAKVLRPFFGQLSIFAFESTYAMGELDLVGCVEALLRDMFDERTMVKAL